MDADGAVVAGLAEKFSEFRPHADERGWRFYLGSEARAYAREAGCGIAAAAGVVAAAAGVSRTTVMAGAGELADGAGPMPGRVRRPGAGRRRSEEAQPGLRPALRGLLEPGTRGDPVVAVTWTTLSLRDLERQMAGLGFRCGKDALARLLHEDGYSLQGMSRVTEGKQHPDRDAQFQHVNAVIAEFTAAGDPVVSIDGKKKEQLGPFHRPGRSWRPAGDPVRVRDHDFPDEELGKVTPYGIYDIAANTGFVSVGTSHDTAAFAVNAIRLWWRAEGASRYPGARRLLITCDAGGSNSCTGRLWKDELAALAAETGLEITVAHFPPGTSKWNKIEHRLFCHITRTWKTRPLMTREDAVAGIAATTTYQGLKCTAVLDDAEYPDKIKISDQRMKYLEEHALDRGPFHGEWNYTVRPAPAQPPEQAPAPGPDLEALAALAGIPDLRALLAAVAVTWQADRERRLHISRGGARTKNSGPAPRALPYEAIVAAAACRQKLNMTYALLSQVLGVHNSTISEAAGRIIPLLENHGITAAPPGTPRITTITQLRERAAAAGITITGITPQAAPTGAYQPDTPETANL
jgi:Rhodopirellula transposase DDE domain